MCRQSLRPPLPLLRIQFSSCPGSTTFWPLILPGPVEIQVRPTCPAPAQAPLWLPFPSGAMPSSFGPFPGHVPPCRPCPPLSLSSQAASSAPVSGPLRASLDVYPCPLQLGYTWWSLAHEWHPIKMLRAESDREVVLGPCSDSGQALQVQPSPLHWALATCQLLNWAGSRGTNWEVAFPCPGESRGWGQGGAAPPVPQVWEGAAWAEGDMRWGEQHCRSSTVGSGRGLQNVCMVGAGR